MIGLEKITSRLAQRDIDGFRKFYSFLRVYYYVVIITPVVLISIVAIISWQAARFVLHIDPTSVVISYPALAFMCIILFGVLVNGRLVDGSRDIETNNRTKIRIKKICKLLSRCEKELILVSGTFFKGVYDSEEVLACFNRLGKGIKITAYVEKCPDSKMPEDCVESVKFLALLKDRGVEINYVKVGTPHTIVVDKRGTRIELDPQKPNDADRKRALIFNGSRAIGSAMARLVERQAA